MVLALALYASTTVTNENTPRYDLEPLYHDGKAHGPKARSGR
jgi:hypothetical protein